MSSVPAHPQIPTNPNAHSVSIRRGGLREGPDGTGCCPQLEGAGGRQGYESVCEKHEAGKRLRNQPEALEAQRPVQSDLGEQSYPPAQAIAHLLVKVSPWEVSPAQQEGRGGQDYGSHRLWL